ncbi:glucose PTS transporter subunit EIIB [Mollicutes bacterium LVI A0078]|nr:glucose PTS transporter subunit EIIB [Mollicutes bacterium LVI A0075]WOO90214.1 glucose PTS transporter subunit EIIB [Mollicutes bacterium LVI A0078]
MEVVSKSSLNEEAELIVGYLGGVDNQDDVDACITRLRVTLKDPDKVDRDGLMSFGASGIVDVSEGIQVIYGAKAVRYKTIINDTYEI